MEMKKQCCSNNSKAPEYGTNEKDSFIKELRIAEMRQLQIFHSVMIYCTSNWFLGSTALNEKLFSVEYLKG
jgi:hypothetical protein